MRNKRLSKNAESLVAVHTKKKYNLKEQEGITLVALVITIIVLLILAGVALSALSGENGILLRATEAKQETKKSGEKEQLGLSYNAAITDKLVNRVSSKTVTADDLDRELKRQNVNATVKEESQPIKVKFNESGNVYTVDGETGEIRGPEITTMSITEVEVGDYIRYGDKLIEETYETKTSDTVDTGYETLQTFKTDRNMLWRVISKKESTVEIVAVKNVLANDNKTGLYLKGQIGFLNAETVLNDLCKKLYSSTNYGAGRSINVGDINNLTGYTPVVTGSKTYTTGGPWWDRESNTFKSPPVKVEGDSNWYIIDEGIDLYDTLVAESKNNSNSSSIYWLANRVTYLGADYMAVRYCVPGLINGRVYSPNCFVGVDNGGSLTENPAITRGVRPIVTLNSNVEIDTSDMTKNGKTPENAYILK